MKNWKRKKVEILVFVEDRAKAAIGDETKYELTCTDAFPFQVNAVNEAIEVESNDQEKPHLNKFHSGYLYSTKTISPKLYSNSQYKISKIQEIILDKITQERISFAQKELSYYKQNPNKKMEALLFQEYKGTLFINFDSEYTLRGVTDQYGKNTDFPYSFEELILNKQLPNPLDDSKKQSSFNRKAYKVKIYVYKLDLHTQPKSFIKYPFRVEFLD